MSREWSFIGQKRWRHSSSVYIYFYGVSKSLSENIPLVLEMELYWTKGMEIRQSCLPSLPRGELIVMMSISDVDQGVVKEDVEVQHK